jgi:hypothetical protein
MDMLSKESFDYPTNTKLPLRQGLAASTDLALSQQPILAFVPWRPVAFQEDFVRPTTDLIFQSSVVDCLLRRLGHWYAYRSSRRHCFLSTV